MKNRKRFDFQNFISFISKKQKHKQKKVKEKNKFSLNSWKRK